MDRHGICVEAALIDADAVLINRCCLHRLQQATSRHVQRKGLPVSVLDAVLDGHAHGLQAQASAA